MQLEIVRATAADADEVFNLLYPDHFLNCGFSHLTFSHENARNVMNGWLNSVAWIARVDGKAAGFAGMILGRTFFVEIEAIVEMFYVKKEYRKYGIARELVKRLTEDADAIGAAHIDATCISGIDGNNDTLWNNLWSKFGFRKLGTIMIRSK